MAVYVDFIPSGKNSGAVGIKGQVYTDFVPSPKPTLHEEKEVEVEKPQEVIMPTVKKGKKTK